MEGRVFASPSLNVRISTTTSLCVDRGRGSCRGSGCRRSNSGYRHRRLSDQSSRVFGAVGRRKAPDALSTASGTTSGARRGTVQVATGSGESIANVKGVGTAVVRTSILQKELGDFAASDNLTLDVSMVNACRLDGGTETIVRLAYIVGFDTGMTQGTVFDAFVTLLNRETDLVVARVAAAL